MSSVTLVEFLAARLAEDEQDARDAAAMTDGGHWVSSYHMVNGRRVEGVPRRAVAECASFGGRYAARHSARHDPARVLREVEAARQALDHYERVRVHARTRAGVDYELALGAVEKQLMYRALAFADHPDYQEAWKP